MNTPAEQLDNARAIQALNAFPEAPLKVEAMMNALRRAASLAREGWVPPDPDLVVVRSIIADLDREQMGRDYPDEMIGGEHDDTLIVRAALEALKRGRELQHEQSTPFVVENHPAPSELTITVTGPPDAPVEDMGRFLARAIDRNPGVMKPLILAGETRIEHKDGAYFSGPRA